jgi:hypothetical protein
LNNPFSEEISASDFRYVLDKDLLKFEAVYPPDTRPLGECAGGKYKIFPRSAVHKLEGSLNWIKQARTIRDGERPYKVVKARPKLNVPREHRAPLTLEVFGYWQTEPYVPPEIVDVSDCQKLIAIYFITIYVASFFDIYDREHSAHFLTDFFFIQMNFVETRKKS